LEVKPHVQKAVSRRSALERRPVGLSSEMNSGYKFRALATAVLNRGSSTDVAIPLLRERTT
jgi:hypothetical protein